MIRDLMNSLWLGVVLLAWTTTAIENKALSNMNDIGQFLGQLTSLLNQGVFQQGAGSPGVVGYQSPYPQPLAPQYPSPPYPGEQSYPPNPGPPYPGERPYPPNPGPPYPGERPYPPNPGPPYPGERPYPPNPGPPYPGERPYPPNPGPPYPPNVRPYQQFPGGYPGQGIPSNPNSLIGALSSIARYDDLRCVPRLLCEVASGARPGSYGSYPSYAQQQQSPVPFLTKDALVTLLTVLNFVDDSPLLVFGRAALLGYTARGDSRACLVAYPTCPRDPDRLVDYLNNHNGGFFRFFNQQLPQYAPQYQQYQPQYPPSYPGPYPPPYPPQRPPLYPQRPYPRPPPPPGYPQQYSSQNQRYQSRIQNKPENILEYNYYTSLSTESPIAEEINSLASSSSASSLFYRDQDYYQQTKDLKPKLVFPKEDEGYPSQRPQSSRGGKSLFFPTDKSKEDRFSSKRLPFEKPITMVFPDRTGTGDLRLDLDEQGHYKTVYFESLQHKGQRQLTFPTRQTMHFPQ